MSSTDWRKVLIEELSEKPRYKPDWKRPSRRVIAVSTEIARQREWPVVVPYYHPSRNERVYEKPRIAIVFDISGAISEESYKMYVEELNDCIKQIEPEELWVIYCDNEVRSVKHYGWPETMILRPPVGIPRSKGAAAYTPAFQYIAQRCLGRVKSIVYLTDLRPTEPWDELNRQLPALFCQTGAKKLLWLIPLDVREKTLWEPSIGKVIWIPVNAIPKH